MGDGMLSLPKEPRIFFLMKFFMTIAVAINFGGNFCFFTPHLAYAQNSLPPLENLPPASKGNPSINLPAYDSAARQALLMDLSTQTVLYEKNADEVMPTSSMSKVMTMIEVFTALKTGRLKLNEYLPVSERAWRTQGSKMWVELGNRILVEDLLRGVIIQSGNDATVVLAEALAGSEEAFAEQLNRRAALIGMKNSQFKNASGWPHPEHYSTARDLAIMAQYLVSEFPEYYKYYSERDFTYHGIKQGNRNPLLYKNLGADGIKTGHTEAAGYGLIGSALRNGRRLLLVINGLPTLQARAQEAERLLEWGYREFRLQPLLAANQTVGTANLWMAAQDMVEVRIGSSPLAMTLRAPQNTTGQPPITPMTESFMPQFFLRLEEPIPAPIKNGAPLGSLIIRAAGQPDKDIPVYSTQDVGQASLWRRLILQARDIWKKSLEIVSFSAPKTAEPPLLPALPTASSS
jgi:serine-type D-Ala-D-Ala carboxypeptidase (penicillin-binding protein 5/6)